MSWWVNTAGDGSAWTEHAVDLDSDGLTIVLTTHDLNGIAAHLPTVVCLNRSVIGAGRPDQVLVPDVLERTYGSPMEVLEHGGMRVVVDAPIDGNVTQLRRRGGGGVSA